MQTVLGQAVSESTVPGTERARSTLEELGQLRRRARGQRRQDSLWASLVAAVSVVGAATFWFADQLESWSCETIDTGLTCFGSMRTFTLGWVWFAAGLLALVVPFWRRYQRGTWRPSVSLAAGLVIGAVIVLPSALPLTNILHPVVYPVAAAAAIAVVAARCRDVAVLAAAVAVAGAVLYVEFRVETGLLLEHNLGLVLSALAAAAVAAAAAVVWRIRDQPR